MAYKIFATNDVLTAADMNAITADAETADVATGETTSSTTYADLTTSGPAVTMSLVNGQGVLVFTQARAVHATGGSGNAAFASFAISGAATLAANDANAVTSLLGGSTANTSTRVTWHETGATGSHTFTMKYKVSGATGTFTDRRIVVKKF